MSEEQEPLEAPAEAPEPTEDAPKPKARKKVTPPRKPYAVVGKGATDPIYLSQLIYENPKTQKSLSVHHLQRRLTELGYGEAGADIDARFGALTQAAVTKYQADNGLEATGRVDEKTFTKIFEGDPNVTLVML